MLHHFEQERYDVNATITVQKNSNRLMRSNKFLHASLLKVASLKLLKYVIAENRNPEIQIFSPGFVYIHTTRDNVRIKYYEPVFLR